MKVLILAVLTAVAAISFSALNHRTAPAEPVHVAPAAPDVLATYPSDEFLAMVHRCITTLLPDSKGVGGNPLRYDAITVSPRYGGQATYELPEPAVAYWHIRIEEDHPHTSVPNGADLGVNTITGQCGHLPMD